MSLSGILIVDKPAQWTSHDVVAKLRGVLGQKRIGHGGTLDPMATGVLPIFIGRATRAVEFCENAEKEYIAGIKFGIVTDTQDITGNLLDVPHAGGGVLSVPTLDELKSVLPRFSGEQKQIPPMYSAIKQNGQKLYELARRGIEAERPARDITVFAIEPIDISQNPGDASDFYLRISCSKGTYIRTLCHDIGAALGCGAVMSYLRRTKAGVFTIDMAHSLDDICRRGETLLPIDSIFSQYPSITLSDADAHRAKNGIALSLSDNNPAANGTCRFYSSSGEFLLLGEVVSGKVRVIKRFFEV